MANLITSMEIVWSQNGNQYHGDFVVKLVWRLSGSFLEKIWYIKLPDNLHINFTIESRKKYHSPYCLHTIYIISTFYGDEICFHCKCAKGTKKYSLSLLL